MAKKVKTDEEQTAPAVVEVQVEEEVKTEDKPAAVDPDATVLAAAAAAAVAAVEGVDVDAADIEATAAALSVVKQDGQDGENEDDEDKKNEHRRKRYRETPNKDGTHESVLASRRAKDRARYATMTEEQRQAYNAKRREQYHRQSEQSRFKRRDRERARYHSFDPETAKERNQRRAKLERERYQKLTPEELEEKNRKRRERAALARQKKKAALTSGADSPEASSKKEEGADAEGPSEDMIKAAVDAATAAVVASGEDVGAAKKEDGFVSV
jgi:hypothetical protein